ncbi:MAG: DUF3187 family protein [Gammaproteobacteria bacterium]
MAVSRLIIAAALAASAVCCAADPFVVTDRYPVARIFAPPAPTSAAFEPSATTSFSVATDWSSSATVSAKSGERLVLDGETVGVTGRWAWHTGGWRIGVDVPLLYQSGGVLDGFIDGFHELFNFPEGDRPDLAQDALVYAYRRNDGSALDVRGTSKGLGDVSLHAGRALVQGDGRQLAWRVHLKLPTGRSERLHGSGTVGVGGSVHGALNRVWWGGAGQWFGGVGAQWHDGSDVLSSIHRPFVASAYAGAQWALRPSIVLRGQLDVHSAYYDSELRGLREAAALTLGGDVRLSRRWWLQLALIEDIAPRTVPDVVFHINVARR